MLSSFVQEYYNILFIFQLTTHKEAIIAFNKYSKQIRKQMRKQIRKQHEKYYLSYYILLLRKTFNKKIA
jgi:uroporphyrinogen-III decarboxylase